MTAPEVGGKLETTRQAIASNFCNYFATHAEKLCSIQGNFAWKNIIGLNQLNSQFKFDPVPKGKATRLLSQLQTSKVLGHDNFPLRFLKNGAAIIGEPLAHMIIYH